MYFNKFNTINYSDLGVIDISQRIAFLDTIKRNPFLTFEYIVEDSELPEHIAYNFYGNASLHWVILLINNIYDPMYGWHLDMREMKNYLIDKYGDLESTAGGYGGIHHWEYNGMELNNIKEMTEVTISDGGVNFELGDLLQSRHKSLKNAEFIVTTIDGSGSITTIEITDGGNFTGDPDTNFKLYGGHGINAVLDGVYSIPSNAVAVSNRQYEDKLNESKRHIRVLYPENISQIKQELEFLLSNGIN